MSEENVAQQTVEETTPVVAEIAENTPVTTEQTNQTSNSEETADDQNVVPANATHGGRETSDKVLYVGNLDKSITEDVLKQYFQVAGQIVDVKVMVDKKNKYVNYAFIEYLRSHDASVALQTLNGIQIENNKVKINRAFQSQQTSDENTFNLFVGDLSIDVNDESLSAQFKDFPSFIQAHVMWDMQTGRSRGYGFVSFADQDEAQKAMDSMQGKDISGRAIRINWATKRENQQQNNTRRGGFQNNNRNNNGMMAPPMSMPMDGMPPQMGQQQPPQQQGQGPMVPPPVNPQAIDDMIRRAPPRVTTAYIGNIPHFATEADLIPLLQNFGFIIDFAHYPEKGCCFIKYDTHDQAAVCIVALANFNFQGRNLRTGWGKERNNFMAPPPQGQPGMMPPVMMADPQQQQPDVPPQPQQQQ